MTWTVEAAESGRYEAILHYTCPAKDVGSEVRLAFGDFIWKGAITVAHDPPARGDENDRVPRRGESLVKDFKTMSLGEVPLQAGKGSLELSATRIPGTQVAEIRAVELVLKP